MSGALNVVPPGCPINVSLVVIASAGIGNPEPGSGAGGVSFPSSPTTWGADLVPKNSIPPFSTPTLSCCICGISASLGASLITVSES